LPLMDKRKEYEFFLLRYVPNAVREEFVNFGLILTEKEAQDDAFAEARFAKDWRRVRCFDPQADIEMLEALEREIRGQLGVLRDRLVLLKWLDETFSNVVQLSQSKNCISNDPGREMDLLESHYLTVRHIGSLPQHKELGGRPYIHRRMREEFEIAGVLGLLLTEVSAGQFTRTGDPLKFDFGYPRGSSLKLFQAVSLKTNVESAVMLAARYPAIAAGMRTSRETIAALTAVVDDDLDTMRDEVNFALAMMQENNIRVARLAEMPSIAQVARKELKA
jgi:hypothetical protein